MLLVLRSECLVQDACIFVHFFVALLVWIACDMQHIHRCMNLCIEAHLYFTSNSYVFSDISLNLIHIIDVFLFIYIYLYFLILKHARTEFQVTYTLILPLPLLIARSLSFCTYMLQLILKKTQRYSVAITKIMSSLGGSILRIFAFWSHAIPLPHTLIGSNLSNIFLHSLHVFLANSMTQNWIVEWTKWVDSEVFFDKLKFYKTNYTLHCSMKNILTDVVQKCMAVWLTYHSWIWIIYIENLISGARNRIHLCIIYKCMCIFCRTAQTHL